MREGRIAPRRAARVKRQFGGGVIVGGKGQIVVDDDGDTIGQPDEQIGIAAMFGQRAVAIGDPVIEDVEPGQKRLILPRQRQRGDRLERILPRRCKSRPFADRASGVGIAVMMQQRTRHVADREGRDRQPEHPPQPARDHFGDQTAIQRRAALDRIQVAIGQAAQERPRHAAVDRPNDLDNIQGIERKRHRASAYQLVTARTMIPNGKKTRLTPARRGPFSGGRARRS